MDFRLDNQAAKDAAPRLSGTTTSLWLGVLMGLGLALIFKRPNLNELATGGDIADLARSPAGGEVQR